MIFNDLPKKIAVFPLSNGIFFPKTILPLNIFEQRYLQLVTDCMKNNKLFGMIQPKLSNFSKPEVYDVGCLGKITNLVQTKDNRFIISLSGIIRFRIEEEVSTEKLYREFKVDYSDFVNDLSVQETNEQNYDKGRLLNKIEFFLKKKNYLIELDSIKNLNFDQLISTICMLSPFSVEEKQKLIETIKIEDKLNILETIVNFNLADNLKNKTIQ